MALRGLKRTANDTARKFPVTVEMMSWIRAQLNPKDERGVWECGPPPSTWLLRTRFPIPSTFAAYPATKLCILIVADGMVPPGR